MAGIENPTLAQVDKARMHVCQVACATKLIAHFIQSGEFDMSVWGYEVGEALGVLSDSLDDAFCTLNSAS